LHTQIPLELGDGTVVDIAVTGVVDHTTFPSVTDRKSETHLNVPGRRSTTPHEVIALVHVLDEHGLLDPLVDDELISNEVILDLGYWLAERFLQRAHSEGLP
jgi:hypothetical protein